MALVTICPVLLVVVIAGSGVVTAASGSRPMKYDIIYGRSKVNAIAVVRRQMMGAVYDIF